MEQVDRDASAGRGQRVADGDGAAVHVRLRTVEPQLLLDGEILRGEGLIHLHQVHLLELLAGLLQPLPRGRPSSSSFRVSLYFSGSPSAVSAMERPHCGSLSASHKRSSRGAGPSRRPQRAPRTTCGAWLIDSVPPASTAWASPSMMSWAPWVIASNPEPHNRLTVTAGTSIGKPALSPTWRAQ